MPVATDWSDVTTDDSVRQKVGTERYANCLLKWGGTHHWSLCCTAPLPRKNNADRNAGCGALRSRICVLIWFMCNKYNRAKLPRQSYGGITVMGNFNYPKNRTPTDNFCRCTVHFDIVKIPFYQQMHLLLNT